MSDPYREEEEAGWRHSTLIVVELLEGAAANLRDAAACPDYEQARCAADRVMEMLRDFVRSSKPPGPIDPWEK
jgi:hypothetical protein